MADVIVLTTRENLMIAPSTIQLAGAEIELTSQPRRVNNAWREAVKSQRWPRSLSTAHLH